MEKVRGLQNLAFQLGLDEGKFLTWSTFLRVKSYQGLISLYNITELSSGHQLTRGYCSSEKFLQVLTKVGGDLFLVKGRPLFSFGGRWGRDGQFS